MTPDRRLDQLEPLMADSLQKIDRLIEGQGQLVELATNTKIELEQVKKTGELTAGGLANLTISTQKQFDELRVGQEELIVGQEELRAGQEGLRLSQDELRVTQGKLIAGQELILQILREKLP